jgi:intracellular septation protein A
MLYFVFWHLREIQAAMFRFVILTCFLAGGKFDQYKKINKFSLIQEKCP